MSLTKEQEHLLLTCGVSEIRALFPGYPMDALRKRRKALQSAVSQREWRKRNPPRPGSYLGHLDGPPIDRCPTQEYFIQDAIRGNELYVAALKRAGA
jgi:hypothetical protein